jgi:predicted phage tail protein
MLHKLKLYGELADFIGHKEFDIKVNTLSQAVSFLVNNFSQVEKFMNTKYYQIKVGNYTINEQEIHHPIGQEDIHIVPVITGAGGSTGKVLLGAALIGTSFLFPGAGMFGTIGAGGKIAYGTTMTGFTAGSAFMTGVGTLTSAIGASLVLQGVSEMLFPVPQFEGFNSEQDPQLSYSFAGTQNTSRAGTPVPIVYGEIFTGSVVISGAVDTQQVQA